MSAVTFARLRVDHAPQNAVTSFTFAASAALGSAATAARLADSAANRAAPAPHARSNSRRSIDASVIAVSLGSTSPTFTLVNNARDRGLVAIARSALERAEAVEQQLLLERQRSDE